MHPVNEIHDLTEGWMQNDSISFFIQYHLEPFRLQTL